MYVTVGHNFKETVPVDTWCDTKISMAGQKRSKLQFYFFIFVFIFKYLNDTTQKENEICFRLWDILPWQIATEIAVLLLDNIYYSMQMDTTEIANMFWKDLYCYLMGTTEIAKLF